MFDVIWTDPNRELVGERRARKEQERADDGGSAANNERGRPSTSTGSSTSFASVEKQFAFFGSKSLRKKSSTPSKAKSTATTALAPALRRTPSTNTKNQEGSPFGIDSFLTTATSPTIKATTTETSSGGFLPEQQFAESESLFSKWTERSAASAASSGAASGVESIAKSKVTQTLGPSSFITKETEVTVMSRTADNCLGQLVTEVSISSDAVRTEVPTTPVSESFPPPFTALAELPGTPLDPTPQPAPKTNELAATPVSPSTWTRGLSSNPCDAGWKPPEAWNVSPVPEPETSAISKAGIAPEPNEGYSMSLDLNGMQRELKRMAAASESIILVRLKEEWGKSDDATLYKELEMEKKRWMLSAIHTMDQNLETESLHPSPSKWPTSVPPKILALHESQASASFLAALHHNIPVYHLSPAPLPHTLFPNVHPIVSPGKPSATISVAPQLFTQVHSIALPTLLPSPEIPQLLRSIHRCLAPLGVLNLTLIDPSPSAATLGPKMRAWLDENLLFNLEKNFRCMTPSKLFPIWLADACLRGEGSTITTVKFFAIPPTQVKDKEAHARWEYGNNTTNENPPDGRGATRVELRSIVGRMLWKEVWGSYITADKWWWEDPACIEECTTMGTFWEYSLIEAVKEA